MFLTLCIFATDGNKKNRWMKKAEGATCYLDNASNYLFGTWQSPHTSPRLTSSSSRLALVPQLTKLPSTKRQSTTTLQQRTSSSKLLSRQVALFSRICRIHRRAGQTDLHDHQRVSGDNIPVPKAISDLTERHEFAFRNTSPRHFFHTVVHLYR